MAKEITTEPTDEEWDRRIGEHMEQTKDSPSLPVSEDAWLSRNPPHPGGQSKIMRGESAEPSGPSSNIPVMLVRH